MGHMMNATSEPSNVVHLRRVPHDQLPATRLTEELREMKNHPATREIAEYVRTQYRKAAQFRAGMGIDEDMRRAMRAVKNEYDPELKCLVEGVDIYMGLTNLKVRALVSWIHDILMNAQEQPWAIKATPDEELSDALETVIAQRLATELESFGIDGEQQLMARAKELKSQARKYKKKVAERAAAGMTLKIKDQLLQGNWRDTFSQFVHDLAMYPTAIIKGPFLEKQAVLKWQGNAMVTRDVLRRKTARVDPFNFFPSPDSATCQDGAYVIERMPMSADGLLDCIMAPGFDETQIRQAIDQYPGGHTTGEATVGPEEIAEGAGASASNGATDLSAGTSGFTMNPTNEYEVLIYSGRLPAAMLQQHGLLMTYDPQKSCEAEVWVIGEYVIKAMLNPHPLGKRPYAAASFQTIPGQFWGQSLPSLLRDNQRVVNSAARSLVRNMGYSSGPTVEVDANRMKSEEQLDVLEPWRIYYVDNGDGMAPNTAPAIRYNVVPSIAGELMKVHDYYSKLADDISGIPAYVLGNPQVAGAGRTLGGLAMLMGNAAKGVKQVVANIDRHVIEPIVEQFYMLEMLFGTDDSVKGDAQVIARGATGILQRELSRANAVEILQIITPYVQGGTVGKGAIKILLRDIIGSMGYDNVDALIEDPDRRGDLMAALKAAGVDVEAIMARQSAQGAGDGQPVPQAQVGRVRPPGAGTRIPQLNLPREVVPDSRSKPRVGIDALSRVPGFADS